MRIPGIQNIVMIASGKGGVGKSTTAVNCALALALEGLRVGLLDADIHGPNQPVMLGTQQRPEILDNKKIKPVDIHGLKTMSMGYLIDLKAAMIWRGPMVSQALHQLLFDTLWGDLDYLLIDLPPGTGDVLLTLAKKVALTGAVLVTTPQEVSLSDTYRCAAALETLHIPILGVIENMSLHTCAHCGHSEAIFGEGGGHQLAMDCKTMLLGQLPLNSRIRKDADAGKPTVIADPESPESLLYRKIAHKLAECCALHADPHAYKFPKIVIE